tara:strand:+ start:16846 stop:17355 length:510 start_codon:yes stop_codon:yes gene_type:complete
MANFKRRKINTKQNIKSNLSPKNKKNTKDKKSKLNILLAQARKLANAPVVTGKEIIHMEKLDKILADSFVLLKREASIDSMDFQSELVKKMKDSLTSIDKTALDKDSAFYRIQGIKTMVEVLQAIQGVSTKQPEESIGDDIEIEGAYIKKLKIRRRELQKKLKAMDDED